MTTMTRIGSAGTHTPVRQASPRWRCWWPTNLVRSGFRAAGSEVSECIRVIVVIVVHPRQVFRCLAVSMLDASQVAPDRGPTLLSTYFSSDQPPETKLLATYLSGSSLSSRQRCGPADSLVGTLCKGTTTAGYADGRCAPPRKPLSTCDGTLAGSRARPGGVGTILRPLATGAGPLEPSSVLSARRVAPSACSAVVGVRVCVFSGRGSLVR